MTVAEVAAPTRARILDPAAIDLKLALNTYKVDASRAHIRIIDTMSACIACDSSASTAVRRTVMSRQTTAG